VMRRPLAALTLVLALLAATGCDSKGGGGQAQAQGAPPAPPTVTVAAPLVRRLTEYDEFTGRFEPVQQVEIRARVSGYVQQIEFQDGESVEPGQILFIIDPRPYHAAVDRAQAQLDQALAQLKLAQLEQSRAAQLVSTAAQAKAVLDQRDAELLSAQATVETNTAVLRDAQLNLGFTQVKAPFKGRISNRRADVGNLVDASTLLTTIVQLDPIYLSFDMSEADYLAYQRAVAAGELPSTRDRKTPIDVKLVDETDWMHPGTMDFVDNVVSQTSGTIRGRAIIPNPNGLITPGQFGRIRVPASPEHDAILVPDAAIVTDQSRKVLMTVSADGTVVPKEIRPGPSQPGGLRIVRAGLAPDDRIVIDGLIRARPGAKVTPQEGKIQGQPELANAG
jgi:RND family efflux transporter MFP subunit